MTCGRAVCAWNSLRRRTSRDVHARVVADDELVLVIAAHHSWAERTDPVGLDELAATSLVVREGGSGTREALEAVVGDSPLAPPAMVLGSNAAVRIAVASGAGRRCSVRWRCVRSWTPGDSCACRSQATECAVPFTAVWTGPRRLTGAAAELGGGRGQRSGEAPGVTCRRHPLRRYVPPDPRATIVLCATMRWCVTVR